MLCGEIARVGAEWRLTLYVSEVGRRRAMAVVIGSDSYVRSALVAAGLALPEDRDRWERALVGSQPTNRNAKGLG